MDARLSIERFRSSDELVRIMRHPAIWPWITDDGTPEWSASMQIPETWMERCVYAVCANSEPVGFALFEPRSVALAEFHGALLPDFRGAPGLRLARMAVARFWQDSGADKLVAMCPAGNVTAQRMNALIGFQREGLLTAAYRRNGRLEDLIVFGMNREGGA
jgi:RimJ/RimL family protein N-acetyltransferase